MAKTAVSDFGPGPDRPLLPVAVEEEDNQGSMRHTRTAVLITSADYRTPPDPTLFGLTGLDLKPGTMVEDERARPLGYWDGGQLQPKRAAAKQAATTRDAEVAAADRRRWWAIRAGGGLAVLALAGSACGVWSYRRRTG